MTQYRGMTPDRLELHNEPVEPDEAYPNQSHKTHKLSGIKNKYRNMPCPCRSGKKLKKCCIHKVD